MGNQLSQSNKKVIGAVKKEYDGIKFDSLLEISCYKLLKENNIPFEYNKNRYIILPEFRLNKLNLYRFNGKKKGFGQLITKKGLKAQFQSITYSPDFVIKPNSDIYIFIETKGNPNDQYPLRSKLFFATLENMAYKQVFFFEPRNVSQIKISINKIIEILNESNNKDQISP